jgi:hypothetical protein
MMGTKRAIRLKTAAAYSKSASNPAAANPTYTAGNAAHAANTPYTATDAANPTNATDSANASHSTNAADSDPSAADTVTSARAGSAIHYA